MSRVLILGAGVSGLAAARLAARLGHSVTLYDRQASTAAIEAGFSVATGTWDPILLNGIDFVVASPGFSERSLPVTETLESGLPIWSEIEFASRHVQAPMGAVTGTNGKTSVTEAAAAMLDASGIAAPASGNIGAPLSDFTSTDYDALVVEVSSFQLRFTETFHPVAAVITNVAVDHLDWHGSVHSYESAKAKIYENQTGTDVLIYDSEDAGATRLAAAAPAGLFPVSARRIPEGGGGFDGKNLVVDEVVIDAAELTSDDPMHLTNLACAAALATHLGATPAGIASAAISFQPGAHRRQLVAKTGGVTWINDSKATNPHAALASIRAQGPVVLIAGGLAKGVDLDSLASEPNIELLIGIGESGPALVEAAGERGRLAGTLEVAVEMAASAARTGQTVLLAPGCASFDQFESYTSRGERFAELVKERLGAQ